MHCSSAVDSASRCVIAGNAQISGRGSINAVGKTTLKVAGILCKGGACAKISRNIVTGHESRDRCYFSCTGIRSHGLHIESGGAFVDRNRINAGCGGVTTGLYVARSWSRIQNNIIQGRECPVLNNQAPAHSKEFTVDVSHGPDGNQVDLHSNTVAPCTNCMSYTTVTWRAADGRYRSARRSPQQPARV